ncbi:MAG: hypothetical protein GX558_02090 [Clostridiales bacterium]|nr:hypothetical protein [Clostridiales bacterium]
MDIVRGRPGMWARAASLALTLALLAGMCALAEPAAGPADAEPPPTEAPAGQPTDAPSETPAGQPTDAPAEPTPGAEAPATAMPSAMPSAMPTEVPSPLPEGALLLSPEAEREGYRSIRRLSYLPGGMAIPALYQYHYTDAVATRGGEEISVASAGSGATALSMVVIHLTGDRHRTPYTLLRRAIERGLYDGGLGRDALSALAAECGVDGRWVAADKGDVAQALNAGHPIIAAMGPGTFAGRCIVLRGVAEDGSIYVNDPGSASHSERAHSFDLIAAEAGEGAPFMVCAPSGAE